jgi:hypothetical protein
MVIIRKKSGKKTGESRKKIWRIDFDIVYLHRDFDVILSASGTATTEQKIHRR